MADTKEIAPINNEMAVAALNVGDDNTGIDDTASISQPKELRVYQSNLQNKYFVEGSGLSDNDYGKLFLYEDGIELKRSDLVSSITGTLLRYTHGFIVYVPVAGKPDKMEKWIGSGKGMIGNTGVISKEDFAVKFPDWVFQNQVKLIFIKGTAEEAVNSYMYGGNPFFQVVLRKQSYQVSFTVGKKMKAAVSNALELQAFLSKNGLKKVPAHAYKFTISSEKKYNEENKMHFYVPKFEIEVNSVQDIIELRPMFDLFLDYRAYGDMDKQMKEASSADEVETEAEPVIETEMETEATVVAQQPTKKPAPINDEDLPF